MDCVEWNPLSFSEIPLYLFCHSAGPARRIRVCNSTMTMSMRSLLVLSLLAAAAAPPASLLVEASRRDSSANRRPIPGRPDLVVSATGAPEPSVFLRAARRQGQRRAEHLQEEPEPPASPAAPTEDGLGEEDEGTSNTDRVTETDSSDEIDEDGHVQQEDEHEQQAPYNGFPLLVKVLIGCGALAALTSYMHAFCCNGKGFVSGKGSTKSNAHASPDEQGPPRRGFAEDEGGFCHDDIYDCPDAWSETTPLSPSYGEQTDKQPVMVGVRPDGTVRTVRLANLADKLGPDEEYPARSSRQ